jgi:hypothetical protein
MVSRKVKEDMRFSWGLVGGVMLGIAGNLLVTSMFRFIDQISWDNIYYLGLSIALLMGILWFVLRVANQVLKKP